MPNRSAWRVMLPICFTAIIALFGRIFAGADSLWFRSLIKPEIMPLDGIFSYVWCALYVLFALSAIFAFMNETAKNTENAGNVEIEVAATEKAVDATYFYALNGVLTAFWTLLFFERHRMISALFVLIALIFSTVHLMRRVDKASGLAMLLLLPQLLWLIFSLALNYSIAMLN